MWDWSTAIPLASTSACAPSTTRVRDWSLCTGTRRCDYGEGDCDYDWDCAGNLVCGQDRGTDFGRPANFDVCVDPDEYDPPPCPSGQKCCEPIGNQCLMCVPNGAQCP